MKKINKFLLGVCLAIGLAIVFCGCATNTVAKNLMTPDVNAENFCVISFDWDLYKIEINGKRYSPANKWFGYTSKSYILPPGNYKIVVQFNSDFKQNAYEGVNTWVENQQVIEKEFANGQYYYILPLLYKGKVTAMVINETDTSVWEKQEGGNDWQERRKNVDKQLGIK